MMGRRRKVERKLKAGEVYRVDRRYNQFEMYRKIYSRQHSRNEFMENIIFFDIMPTPTDTTIMVLDHSKLFGRDYVKVMASNSEGKFEMGYMPLFEFLTMVRGEPTWVILPLLTKPVSAT